MNDVNPVTESEMQDWFRRLSTMIVNSSTASQEIKRLQADVATITNKVTELQGRVEQAGRELADTWSLVQTVERERDSAKAEVERVNRDLDSSRDAWQRNEQDYQGRLQQAHDAMAQRDQRIAELEAKVAQQETDNSQFKASLDARNADLTVARDNSKYWQERAGNAESNAQRTSQSLRESEHTIAGLSDKLKMVQTKVEEFRSLFAPVPPVQEGNIQF